MAEKIKETPESLLKFFRTLAETTGIDDDGEEGGVDYSSPGVARRGLEAAKMLMAIQQVMGVKPGGPAAAPAAATPGAAPSPEAGKLAEELAESQAENDALLRQNTELGATIKNLKEKVQILQKQVERLYNKNEMSKTLKTIETKKLSAVEQVAMGESGAEAEASAPTDDPPLPEEPKAEEPEADAEAGVESGVEAGAGPGDAPEAVPPPPAEEPKAAPKAKMRRIDKELHEEIAVEAAARVPKEELEKEKEAAKK